MTQTSQPFLVVAACAALSLCALSAGADDNAAPMSATAGTSLSVTPEGNRHRGATKPMSIAVVSATDTNGSIDVARRALIAANAALSSHPGYAPIAVGDVTRALQSMSGVRGGFEAVDHQAFGKLTKAARTLTIMTTAGPQSDASANYTAIAELYDTKSGGLIGRGQGSFTATPDNTPPSAMPAPARRNGANGTANGTAAAAPVAPTPGDLRQRALSGAVVDSILALDQTAQLTGIVISRPTIEGGYMARLSLGELDGLRAGSRIEYLANGEPIAYGTVVDLGGRDSVATIAPETALPSIFVNAPFRTASIPIAARATRTAAELDDAEYRKFERQFAIGAGIAGALYLIFK